MTNALPPGGHQPGRPFMARPLRPQRGLPRWFVPASIVLVTLVVLAGGSALLAGQPGGASPTDAPSDRPTAIAAGSPSSRPSAQSTAVTASPRPTLPPSPSVQPTASGTPNTRPSPTPTSDPNAAPSSAADFDLRSQVIDIDFPLRPETNYHYRDNFLEPRSGTPDTYNHAALTTSGRLRRLHDGIDIYAPEGEPVVAPFSGRIIDPATRWQPWEPDRYGLTVVIESDEPTSDGYAAVLVHLERVWVDVGQVVSRGQVIGVLGQSGNADGVKPQLHFELRAPFALDWTALGENRRVDAFNPYPSLIEADPNY